mgnify:CR=1 FL=1
MSEKRRSWFGSRRDKAAPKPELALAPEPEEKSTGWISASPILTEWMAQTLGLWDGTMASYGTVYRKLAPVRTVVDFIAAGVSTTPLKCYRREDNGRPEQHDHPLAVRLRQPNPDLTEKRLKFRTTADLAIYGNAYWRKVPVRRGVPDFLVPIPPHRITPRQGDLSRATWYDFWPVEGSGPIKIPSDEIVHFSLYDPEDPRVGSSKLEALRAVLNEEIEASRSRRGFWLNNAALASVLTTPDVLSEEGYERLKTQLANEHVGSANAGKTAILEAGMDIKPFGATPREAEFIAGRQFVLEATARVFNVPLPVLSLTRTATYASQEQFRKAIYQDLLPEWFETIESEIELQLMPDYRDTEDLFVEFSVEAKLRGDFVDQAKVMNDAVGRPHMTVREARKLLNLPDRGEDRDDELVVPVGPNLALEGMATAAPAAPAAPLASVTELPTTANASERFDERVVIPGTNVRMKEFFDRQERAVLPRLGAKAKNAFDRERWDVELAEIVGEAEAQRINLETAMELAASDDPHGVFERRRAALGG